MTRDEFFTKYEATAAAVGKSFSRRLRFVGWESEDAEQFARLTLWQLAGKQEGKDLNVGYVRLTIRREMQKQLRPSRNLFTASTEKLSTLVAPPDGTVLLDAPVGVGKLLSGDRITRSQRREVLSWLR